MEAKTKRSHRTVEEMTNIMSTWKTSGLSGHDFCKGQQLPYTVFQYWRRKLEAENNQVEPGFIELTNTLTSSPELEILFPSGAKIVLSAKADPDFIRSLVK